MTTQNNNKAKKENQFVFVEYEKANDKGHVVTVMDSYRNIIGRIHRSYNQELKKYEFTAYDHAGKEMFKGDQLWQLKKEFTNQREKFLEEAHQRRINRKKELDTIRQSKGEQKEQGIER